MWHPMLCREISLLLACQTKLLTHTHPFVGIHAKRLSWFLNNGQKTKYITAEPAFSRRFKEWASSYRVNTKVIGRLWVIGLWLYVRESILSGTLTRSTGTRRNVECRLSHIYWRLWTTPFLSSGLPAKALQEQICSVTSCVKKKKKNRGDEKMAARIHLHRTNVVWVVLRIPFSAFSDNKRSAHLSQRCVYFCASILHRHLQRLIRDTLNPSSTFVLIFSPGKRSTD